MSRRTIPRPRPRLPPVTMTLRRTGQLAGDGNLERRNETDGRRNLVGGQVIATELEDLTLEVHHLAPGTARVGISLQDDVGDDERTGNGHTPGLHHRHADRRVSVVRSIGFLWGVLS